jgi:predicted acyl esterase
MPLILAFTLFATGGPGHASPAGGEAKISKPGQYAGYSPAKYDGYVRTSFYVRMRDGTKLAVDLFRPTDHGILASERLPVVWMHDPYNRRSTRGRPTAEVSPGFALELVKYGYNVAVVDYRGLFASYGTNKVYNVGEFAPPATTDAYDMTEWFAGQPWSNGRIGMWGCSAPGASQMQAATTLPPSLKAIFPMSSAFDLYSTFVVGGVTLPRYLTPEMADRTVRDATAAPVDGPDGPAELAEAIAQHKGNIDAPDVAIGKSAPFRDSRAAELGGVEFWKLDPSTYQQELKDGHFGVYATSTWAEAGTRIAAFQTFANLPKGRVKLLVGPGGHCGWSEVDHDTGFSILTEELRFFDYWLKGKQNGVMDESPVTYFTYNAPRETAWRTASTWPLPNEVRTKFYLDSGHLDLRQPIVNGRQATAMTPAPEANHAHVGIQAGGLTFETSPLERDTEVTGHPVIDLWIETSAPDTDVLATLYDAAPDGSTRTYQMFGRLRASNRALAQAPYNNLGLPWHSFRAQDARPLEAGKPTELQFDMLPMSYIIPKGHRIRLTVTFADPSGGQTSPVTVLTGSGLSSLTLPLIPSGSS